MVFVWRGFFGRISSLDGFCVGCCVLVNQFDGSVTSVFCSVTVGFGLIGYIFR